MSIAFSKVSCMVPQNLGRAAGRDALSTVAWTGFVQGIACQQGVQSDFPDRRTGEDIGSTPGQPLRADVRHQADHH